MEHCIENEAWNILRTEGRLKFLFQTFSDNARVKVLLYFYLYMIFDTHFDRGKIRFQFLLPWFMFQFKFLAIVVLSYHKKHFMQDYLIINLIRIF